MKSLKNQQLITLIPLDKKAYACYNNSNALTGGGF